MISLTYISTANYPMPECDLMDILRTSQQNNERLAITGLLLYKDEHFMQVLEGEKGAVLALYEIISRDPRHRNIITIACQEIDQREFQDWRMAFLNVETIDPLDYPSYSRYMHTRLDTLADNPSSARRLLHTFKEIV